MCEAVYDNRSITVNHPIESQVSFFFKFNLTSVQFSSPCSFNTPLIVLYDALATMYHYADMYHNDWFVFPSQTNAQPTYIASYLYRIYPCHSAVTLQLLKSKALVSKEVLKSNLLKSKFVLPFLTFNVCKGDLFEIIYGHSFKSVKNRNNSWAS